jgi:hypothetical protein
MNERKWMIVVCQLSVLELTGCDHSKKSIVHFYNKTNPMHNISNLFYFGTTLYMFRTISPSIIRSLRLYIQHQVYVIQVLWLLASKKPQNLYDTMLYVQSSTPVGGGRDGLKHVECFFLNKINLRYCASGWFYHRNILPCMFVQTSKRVQYVLVKVQYRKTVCSKKHLS